MRKVVFSILFSALGLSLVAQSAMTPYRSFTPKDSWEVGIGIGLPFVSGDMDAKFPGFGGSLHARKALDHIFSIRPIVSYQTMKSELSSSRSTSSLNLLTAGVDLVAALNNFRFDRPQRKVLFTGIVGGGIASYNTDFENVQLTPTSKSNGTYKGSRGYLSAGLGLAYRINPRFNIGFDYPVYLVWGTAGDQLDAVEGRSRDFVNFPKVSLNFNLLGKAGAGAAGAVGAVGAGAAAAAMMDKTEPLYWVNPNTIVADAIDKLEKRPIYDPTDTDKDGIIDAIDEEDNSPAGARVDSRGLTLDSDGDKVPDYMDKEPFSPPGYTYSKDGVANVPKPNYVTEADVNRIVDAKLANFKLPTDGLIKEWFMPMVNFDLGRSDIKTSEYSKLYQVASVLKSNPTLTFAVTGHTDLTGSEGINQVLSYNRAKAVIDFLAKQYGVDANRLVLKYAGEGAALVPGKGQNYANRRVEFNVSRGEASMTPPPAAGRFKANTSSGY